MTTATAPQIITKKRKVLLVDDHRVLREGLRDFINAQPDLTVCGMAEFRLQALAEVEIAQPDIVVTEIALKGRVDFDLIRQVKARRPSVPILVLSMHNETAYSVAALQAGAGGFVLKTEPPENLLSELRRLLPAASAG